MAIARFIARQYATSFCIVRDMETVRYTYRLRPGAGAAEALASEWHRCRFLWNEAVHQQRSGFNPTPAKLGKLLTAARANCAWLREGSQNTQQQALRCYATALDRSFKIKNCGRPVFKSRRKSLPSLEYTRNGFSLIGSRLRLPKRAGRKVVMVQPAYTTMTCSECFARTKRLELCERTFQCRDCGYSDSRDRNAARVILAVAERGHTCVDDVRRLQSSLGSVAGAI